MLDFETVASSGTLSAGDRKYWTEQRSPRTASSFPIPSWFSEDSTKGLREGRGSDNVNSKWRSYLGNPLAERGGVFAFINAVWASMNPQKTVQKDKSQAYPGDTACFTTIESQLVSIVPPIADGLRNAADVAHSERCSESILHDPDSGSRWE